MTVKEWKDEEGRRFAWIPPTIAAMNYNNRKYYWELERKYKIKFRTKKYELYGKERDGITDAQKRKLWALGVNVTGILYKGTAIEVINFVESLKCPKPEKLFQVIYSLNGKSYKSKMLFCSISDAEYEIARKIPPKYDVEIIPYTGICWQTTSGKLFAKRESALETKEHYFLVR